jgi:hypothetical protein
MSTLFPDTYPEAEAVLIRLLRQRYPREAEAIFQRRLAELLLGDGFARKVYSPLPGET